MTIEKLKKHEEVVQTFEKYLSRKLALTRVQAPLFVSKESLLNDGLNGIERPVSFLCKLEKEWEVVQSLAKWKRVALEKYKVPVGEGIFTNMKAIRRDEILDATHSYFVEQWDWEKVILKKDRHVEFLKQEVKKIYEALLKTVEKYSKFSIPEEITFITAQELEDLYPTLTPNQRETEITKVYKSVFIIGIGWELQSGIPHDGRATDYDDWNLNGDLLVWFEPLKKALELSSMGIRVSKESLTSQMKCQKEFEVGKSKFHKSIVEETIPFTIGGGIGQTRIVMFVLSEKHVQDVQPFINI